MEENICNNCFNLSSYLSGRNCCTFSPLTYSTSSAIQTIWNWLKLLVKSLTIPDQSLWSNWTHHAAKNAFRRTTPYLSNHIKPSHWRPWRHCDRCPAESHRLCSHVRVQRHLRQLTQSLQSAVPLYHVQYPQKKLVNAVNASKLPSRSKSIIEII